MIVKVGGTVVDIRVVAVLSMPRLSFTSNHFAWAQALMPLGIRPTMGTGAFWSQVNTRIFEQFIDKCEYLLTIDYDTFFTKSDVEHLFAMALTFQCDAITGLQTKREDGRPMLTLKGTLDDPPTSGSSTVPADWFAEPVQEVDSAHFGLSGNRVFVSPRVVLGHGEYVVAWPGKNLQAPVFQWTTDFTTKLARPDTAWSVPQS